MRAASEARGWESAFVDTDARGRCAAHATAQRLASEAARAGTAPTYYGAASVKKAMGERERGGRPDVVFSFSDAEVEACLAGVSVETCASIDGISDGRKGAFRVSASQYD